MRIPIRVALALGIAVVTAGPVPAGPPSMAAPAISQAKDIAIGPNITFRRIHSVPQDLPDAPSAPGQGLIVDLRYARGDQRSVGVFGAWLRARAGEKTPLIILANDQTAPFVIGSLSPGKMPPGALTVGPKSEAFTPDLPVEVKPEADRSAYDALEKGTAIEDLITPKTDKPRRDEASYAKERDPAAASSAPARGGKSDNKVAEAAVVDPVLQRAVNLLRGLTALRRI